MSNGDSNSVYWFVAGAALTAAVGSFAFAYSNDAAVGLFFAVIAIVGGVWLIWRDSGRDGVSEA